jgi:hypothetical protein
MERRWWVMWVGVKERPRRQLLPEAVLISLITHHSPPTTALRTESLPSPR